MKERPIIFTEDSVRLIMAGTKTQTRRIINPQPTGPSNIDRIEFAGELGWVPTSPSGKAGIFSPSFYRCPYGDVGDRLWVREVWGLHCQVSKYTPGCRIYYRADPGVNPSHHVWRSPIFMPRAASRLTLEITRIRAMKLQDTNPHDAVAEGEDDLDGYRAVWDMINGNRSPWQSNPWVWAITFEVKQGG